MSTPSQTKRFNRLADNSSDVEYIKDKSQYLRGTLVRANGSKLIN